MQTTQRTWFGRTSLTGMVLLALAALPARAAEARTGEQIYKQQCASCHGARGEGSDEYPHPLAGDKSAAQLARLITRTMPKDAKVKCTGEDAQKVAAFVYDSFYSRTAQARNKPARVELSRLTVRQYRNAVADLVGTFREPGRWGDQRGLRGEYVNARRFNPRSRLLERTDPEVRFDFGTAGPTDKFDANQFSIRWEGSVLAPETGEYEFIVRTEHANRLWVNDLRKPLIDATVKSSNDTEHRASIYLLGGRAYLLRLEFSKAKQGVDDSKKNKPKPVKATIALAWKRPEQTAEVIPSRYLTPNRFPETFAVATAFPPDDRSVGYERGTSVSKAWDQATTDAAIETANYVVGHLPELTGAPVVTLPPIPSPGGNRRVREERAAVDPQKARDFCRRFAERAFRRPLTADQQARYIDRQFQSARDVETAVKRVVLLVLMSPRFLYRDLDGGTDAYEVASRLSFGLWDSLPDKELLEAAAKGQLATREQVARQAERMLNDLRARGKVREFLLQWLKVEHAPDLAKDPKQFPGFDKAVASDLRTSLELFLDDVVWGESSDYRQLMLEGSLYLNGRLAKLYGGDLPPEAPFKKVSFKPGERAGVLTHPYLMAAFAYTQTSSPIHRGVFLSRSVLGQSLRPPPEAFTPLSPDLHPSLTTRERVELQTKSEACMTCHAMINPLGFTLENFDAIGRFRQKEKDRPINPTGGYQTRSGKVVKFAGVRDMATFLAGSEETHDAFVEQLFHYLVKQPLNAYGPQARAELRRSFVENRYSIRKLMVEILASSALTPADEKRRISKQ
jgi:cytochrome c553